MCTISQNPSVLECKFPQEADMTPCMQFIRHRCIHMSQVRGVEDVHLDSLSLFTVLDPKLGKCPSLISVKLHFIDHRQA